MSAHLTDPYSMARTANSRMPELKRRAELDAGMRKHMPAHPRVRCEAWSLGRCSVILTHTPEHGYHLSIAHPFRYPTWDEIAEVRYALVPDEISMGMPLPPRSEYVNLHPNCLQLREWKGWVSA